MSCDHDFGKAFAKSSTLGARWLKNKTGHGRKRRPMQPATSWRAAEARMA